MADRDFPHASIVEGIRFTAQVALPNVIAGLFRRRRTVTAIGSATGTDALAHSFMAGLKRSHGDGPLWIRVGKDETLLALGREAIRHALEGAPDPFAADPEPKRGAMQKFQPDALTISRNPEWKDRRRFTEAVLESGRPHRFGGRFAEVGREEATGLPGGSLDWEAWNEAVRRAARRVILGDEAGRDAELSQMLGELMDKANPPGRGESELLERYTKRLEEHVRRAEAESLVALFSEAPITELTKPEHQVTHWLFALGDTLAINAYRCLALLAVHDRDRERAREDDQYLEACLQEAMRLWPTTPMLSREAVRDIEWDGVPVGKGTQVMIVNAFNHRDSEAFDFADRFAPEQWLSGGAAGDDWTFNHFSHGPQGCPGVDIALVVGKAMLGAVFREREVRVVEPQLDPAKPLPKSLDYFGVRFELS
jgi:cytochrome P450